MHVRPKLLAFSLAVAVLAAALMISFGAAIPEGDLNKFRSASGAAFLFDAYTNSSRIIGINTFHNQSDTYYFVLRSAPSDVSPYDRFVVRFSCSGDGIVTQITTTDYVSWREAGFINFRKLYGFVDNLSYDNSSLMSQSSLCWIESAYGLVPSGNSGYTSFRAEIVPVLSQTVISFATICAQDAKNTLISSIVSGFSSILTYNVDFMLSAWIVFQVLAVIFIVIGLPALVILFIRWVIWKITGKKILGGGRNEG